MDWQKKNNGTASNLKRKPQLVEALLKRTISMPPNVMSTANLLCIWVGLMDNLAEALAFS